MNIRKRWLLILGWAGLFILPFGERLPLTAAPAPSPREAEDRANAHRGDDLRGVRQGPGASFRNMAGVVRADLDYKAGQAVVTFDTAKQGGERLSKFIVSCGYQVKETKVV